MKRIKVIPLIALALSLSACLAFRPNYNPQPVTQLQARAIQTRTYDGQDPVKALKVIFNVLQDDGYVVRFGNTELGLLNASKSMIDFGDGDYSKMIGSNVLGDPAPVTTYSIIPGGNFIASVPTGVTYGPGDVLTVEATANVSKFGGKTKVRVNFERRITNRNGQVINASPLNNAKFYQEFFAKVDKGLFIESEGL